MKAPKKGEMWWANLGGSSKKIVKIVDNTADLKSEYWQTEIFDCLTVKAEPIRVSGENLIKKLI